MGDFVLDYIIYAVAAVVVVVLAVNASRYANMLDRNSKLPGAFIGAVILAAITSLPEFFTSLSSVTIFHMQDFPVGNVLGSNIFNLSVMSLMILVYGKKFKKARLSRVYSRIAIIVIVMYALAGIGFIAGDRLSVAHFGIVSVLIAMLYIAGAKYAAMADDTTADESALKYVASVDKELSNRQALGRLIVTSGFLVIASGVVTYAAGNLTVAWGLSNGFAGAVFLGIATSIPEVTSVVTLFRVKNFDIAVGGIIGSSMFNFLILAVTDAVYLRNIYMVSEPKIEIMTLAGLLSTAFFLLMMIEREKDRRMNIVCPVLIILCYAGFFFI